MSPYWDICRLKQSPCEPSPICPVHVGPRLVQLQRLWYITGQTGPTMTRESLSLPHFTPTRSPPSLQGELFIHNNYRKRRQWKGTSENFPKSLLRTGLCISPPLPPCTHRSLWANLKQSCRWELRPHGQSRRPPGTVLTADSMKHAHWLAAHIFSRIKWAESCHHLCRCGIDLVIWVGELVSMYGWACTSVGGNSIFLFSHE